MPISRRTVFKGIGASGLATFLVENVEANVDSPLHVAGQRAELAVTPIGESIIRISVVPLEKGRVLPIPDDGSLHPQDWGPPLVRLTDTRQSGSLSTGRWRLTMSLEPIRRSASRLPDGRLIQQVRVDAEKGSFAFHLGDGPVLGLGEGGPQFDRRGSTDRMRSGQGGYRLRTHGGRVPVPWLIGTAGWAMFVHQPYGTFDLTGSEGRFTPAAKSPALPLDLFIVTARDPAQIMAEWARLTGHPEMPPLWALGYQQSHRTLASRDEVPLDRAHVSREEAPLRRFDLPRDRILPVGLEHRARVVHLQPVGVPRPEGDARRAAHDELPRGAARRHPLEVGPRDGARSGRAACSS